MFSNGESSVVLSAVPVSVWLRGVLAPQEELGAKCSRASPGPGSPPNSYPGLFVLPLVWGEV